MSKISELSDGGALQSTDYLIAVRSGGNVKVQPAGMTFSSVTITSSDINGGTIDGTVIGGATPAAGSFTTGQFDTSLNVDGTVTADGLTVNGSLGNFAINTGGNQATFDYNGFNYINSTGAGSALVVRMGSTSANAIRFDSDGKVIINDDGNDTDFRVESDSNTHMLFVNAGSNRVGVGEALPGDTLQLNGGNIVNPNSTGSEITSATFGVGGNIHLEERQPNGAFSDRTDLVIVTNTGFGVGESDKLRLAASGAITTYPVANAETVFNESGVDADFRVESDVSTHMLFVDAGNSRVGIGETVPGSLLTLNDPVNAGGAAKNTIAFSNAGWGNPTAANQPLDGGVKLALFSGSTQKVQIGMTPGAAMWFNATGSGTTGFKFYSANTDAATPVERFSIGQTGDSTFNPTGVDADFRIASVGNSHMLFVDASTSRVHIGGSSVGDGELNVNDMIRISGAAPELRIDVGSAGYYLQLTEEYNFPKSIGHIRSVASTSYDGQLQFSANQGGGAFRELARMDYVDGTVFNETSVDLDFRVESDANTNMLYVDAADGYVSIASTNPGASWRSTDGVRFLLYGHGTNGYSEFVRTSSSDTSANIYIVRNNDGRMLSFNTQSAEVGSVTITSSATAYNTSSDARLKENIADAEDASSLVDAIKVRQFDWKADGSHQRYGMVAQELLEVAPEAVSQPEDPEEMMGVDYSKLVPMLIKEIQSLRARVAQLEGA